MSSNGLGEFAIRADKLSKIYKLYDRNLDRLKEVFHPFKKAYHNPFYALRDVSFEIKPGESVGIIGQNGSGKSTLLKILSGVLTPSSGSYAVNGRISALLELGAGFNPDLTGVENIYFQGTILGYSKAEIESKMDAIVGFADIGHFIHQPVKTYSSGMFIRLAFSVATNVEPEILIVDEALSVGDMFFQAKCLAKMKKMLDNGTTLLFVSHDIASVTALCSRALYLEKGELKAAGSAQDVSRLYFSSFVTDSNANKTSPAESETPEEKHPTRIHQDSLKSSDLEEFKARVNTFRSGTGLARVEYAEVLKRNGAPLDHIATFDEEITLVTYIRFHERIRNAVVAYHLLNAKRVFVTGCTTLDTTDIYHHEFQPGDLLRVEFLTRLPFVHDTYSFTIVVDSFTDRIKYSDVVFHDWIDNAYVFEMRMRTPQLWDLVEIPHTVNCEFIPSLKADPRLEA
ncbi:MAG: ABC transporter ATP-binding protein [Bdellovibrionales bacterium]